MMKTNERTFPNAEEVYSQQSLVFLFTSNVEIPFVLHYLSNVK